MRTITIITFIALTTVLILSVVYNQADQISRRLALDDAVRFCMKWRIPEALVIDGNRYCKTHIQMYSPTGVVLQISQIWSEKEMQTVFKNLEVSPYCDDKIKENCIQP